jgi:ATP/maltotriose-dependent transcriptional regulator MalT
LAFSSEGDHSAPGLILALDDYQTITEPEIHKLVSALLRHLPRSVHLALATRSDAPLPLPQLRARRGNGRVPLHRSAIHSARD